MVTTPTFVLAIQLTPRLSDCCCLSKSWGGVGIGYQVLGDLVGTRAKPCLQSSSARRFLNVSISVLEDGVIACIYFRRGRHLAMRLTSRTALLKGAIR